MNSVPCFKRIVKRPHRTYKINEIQEILEYLSQENLPYGALSKISNDTGIPQQTLSDWRKHERSPGGQNWIPNPSSQPSKYALSPQIEQSTYDYINDNFLKIGLPLTRSALHDVALNAYSSSDNFQVEKFSASN